MKLFLSVLFVVAFFSVVLIGTQGYFADEFQYFQSYGDGMWGGDWTRMPMIPFLVNQLSFLGIEYQNELGLYTLKVLQWSLGIIVAYLLGRELGGKFGGIFSILVLGTFYTWVFYSSKILTDALLTSLAIWLVFFLIKYLKEHRTRYVIGFLVTLLIGILTKVTFLAFLPLAIISIVVCKLLKSERKYLLVLAIMCFGFLFSLYFVNIIFETPGADRYFLPFWTLFLLLIVYVALKFDEELGRLVTFFFMFVGILSLFIVFPIDSVKFSELEETNGLKGMVAANLPDYTEFYCDNCVVHNYWNVKDNLQDYDFVALTRHEIFLYDEVMKEQEVLRRDSCWNLVFDYRDLTIFKKSGVC